MNNKAAKISFKLFNIYKFISFLSTGFAIFYIDAVWPRIEKNLTTTFPILILEIPLHENCLIMGFAALCSALPHEPSIS